MIATIMRGKAILGAGALAGVLLVSACSNGAAGGGAEPGRDLIAGAQLGVCTTLDLLRDKPLEFPRVSCDGPHDAEVISLIRLEGEQLPTVVELEKIGQDKCTRALGDLQLEHQSYRVYWIRPDETQWDSGVRDMPCVATSETEWSGSLGE